MKLRSGVFIGDDAIAEDVSVEEPETISIVKVSETPRAVGTCKFFIQTHDGEFHCILVKQQRIGPEEIKRCLRRKVVVSVWIQTRNYGTPPGRMFPHYRGAFGFLADRKGKWKPFLLEYSDVINRLFHCHTWEGGHWKYYELPYVDLPRNKVAFVNLVEGFAPGDPTGWLLRNDTLNQRDGKYQASKDGPDFMRNDRMPHATSRYKVSSLLNRVKIPFCETKLFNRKRKRHHHPLLKMEKPTFERPDIKVRTYYVEMLDSDDGSQCFQGKYQILYDGYLYLFDKGSAEFEKLYHDLQKNPMSESVFTDHIATMKSERVKPLTIDLAEYAEGLRIKVCCSICHWKREKNPFFPNVLLYLWFV